MKLLSGIALAMALAVTTAGCASSTRIGCTTMDQCPSGYDCFNGRCEPLDNGDGGSDDDGNVDGTVFPLPDGAATDAELNCAEFTFPMTETEEAFLVPDDARYMHVKAWGAGGNGEAGCPYCGGLGGYSEAVFEVTAGTPLVVIVGKRGRAGTTNEEIVRFGFGHWGGGGLSGVFSGGQSITENDWARALIIAGGGGGASAPGCQPGGSGNHPNAGGMPTMMGGHGEDDVNGGGGGYRGGVGGAQGVGGMGGTGFVSPDALDSIMLYSEPCDVFPPRTSDPDYADNAGQTEMSGRVVIHFKCEPPPVR